MSIIQRIAIITALFGSAAMGWFANGFNEMDVRAGFILSLASVVLFAWLVWDLTDD